MCRLAQSFSQRLQWGFYPSSSDDCSPLLAIGLLSSVLLPHFFVLQHLLFNRTSRNILKMTVVKEDRRSMPCYYEFFECIVGQVLSQMAFTAGFFRSASVLLNVFMATMKIISDYYPGRLHKAFVIDAPSLFPYLWKGARPFVELSTATALVSSLDYEDSLEDETFASYPRTSSLRFDYHHVPLTTTRAIGSTSSRFSFTVSHMDAMKPWYLNTLSDSPTTTNTTSTTASPSLVGVSPLNARSYSFASPAGRSTPRGKSIPSTPSSAAVPPPSRQPRTPRPSFLQSPAMLFSFKKDNGAQGSKAERGRESFLPFLRFYRRPYSEMVYRAKMRPPLAGLVSIVSQQVKQRRHVYHQQRF